MCGFCHASAACRSRCKYNIIQFNGFHSKMLTVLPVHATPTVKWSPNINRHRALLSAVSCLLMDFDAVNITAVRVAVLLVVSFRQLLKDALIYIYIYTYSNDFPSSGQKREDLDTVNQKLETINVTKKKLSIETLSIGLE